MPDLATAAREAQLRLRASTLQQLMTLWPLLDMEKLDATFPGWAVNVGRLILTQNAVSSQLAGEFLRASRLVAGVAGSPVVMLGAVPPVEQIARSLRVTSVIAVKRSMLAGKSIEQASQDAFVQSSGAATRLVLDGGRSTVVRSVNADQRARGWRRVASGKACQFCSMLAGRGAVYREDTVHFRSHDHCGCSAEAVWN